MGDEIKKALEEIVKALENNKNVTSVRVSILLKDNEVDKDKSPK